MPRTAAKPEAEPTTREQERRKTILRAAIEVFARKGYHGCRIADVAKEAGVAYGLVYHYFQNKDELLRSVFDYAWSGFVGRMVAVATAKGPLAEKVRRVTQVAFDAYQYDPRAVRVIILEIARNPAGAKIDRQSAFGDVIALAENMLIEAQDSGELRRDLDPRLCAALLFGAIELGLTSLVLGMYEGDQETLARVHKQIAEAFLGGVLSDGARVEASASEAAAPEASAEIAWKKDRSTTRSVTPRPT